MAIEITPGFIPIGETEMNFIRAHQMLIEQHQLIVAALQAQLWRLLSDTYGIDLENESWNIDLKRGILTQNVQADEEGSGVVEGKK